MRSAFFTVLAALAVVPGSCELSLHESDSPAILRLGVRRNHIRDPVGNDRRRFKRDGIVDVDITGYGMSGELYSANLTLGSPPQQFEVSVDTGSSDLWVVEDDNQVCSSYGARCDQYGSYKPSDSDTFQGLNEPFWIEYGDQSRAEGFYAIDQLEIAGAEIPEIQFGVATTSNIDKGILGIGYRTNVASYEIYTNFPDVLVNNSIIKSNAYSLWLNRLGEDEGNILFGGVNTAHYVGELQTLPVVPVNGYYYHLWVSLTGLGVSSESDDVSKTYEASDFPVVVLLDSGASISYLPADIVEQLYSDLDVHLFEAEQFGYVPCDSYLKGREDYQVTFTFSDLTISVPLRELVLHDAIIYRGGLLDIDGESGCLFGIAPSADFFPILGDSFLRSAYVVFDLDNNEISMAQANYNPGDDHILEIGRGPEAVPDATPVENPVASASVEMSGAALSLPPGYTNDPIFPSNAVESESIPPYPTPTTTGAVSGATPTYIDPLLPFGYPGGHGPSPTSTADQPTPTGAGVVPRGHPALLVAGVAGALVFGQL